MAVEPVVYGASERPPRGDYSRAGADYTCSQNYQGYTAADHDTYRRLYERQAALVPGRACDEFLGALPSLGAKERIPRFEEINERLYRATRWEIVAVPGLIPEVPFFTLLANRRFPVTDWIRTAQEFDYIVEPDVFHDLFGHVPLLFNPIFADHMQEYGKGGLKAHRLGACELLSRLYWYTIEFGLIRQNGGLRAYGAGILSSPGELRLCGREPGTAAPAAGHRTGHAHPLQDRQLPADLLRHRQHPGAVRQDRAGFHAAVPAGPGHGRTGCGRARLRMPSQRGGYLPH